MRGELSGRGGVRIDADPSLKSLSVTDAVRRSAFEQNFQQVRKQGNSFRHRIADAIPLDHRKFRIVQSPALAGPKRLRHLKNCRRARRQEAFHGEFRRSLKPQRSADRRCVRLVGQHDRERVEVTVDDRIAAQQQRFDF